MKKRMKKRILIIAIFIVILSFIIPVKKEEKDVWYYEGDWFAGTSYGVSTNLYYNIYGIKIWPFLSKNATIEKEF